MRALNGLSGSTTGGMRISISGSRPRIAARAPAVPSARGQRRNIRVRSIAVRPREQHEALQAARAREHTEEYKATYAQRAGCEGTISRGVRTCGLRRSRYFGDEKVHLEQVLIGTAMNFLRVSEWLAETPKAKTRRSAFAKLMAPPGPS